MPRLETRALTLAAGNKLLVRDLEVAFEAGQNWAILGANGSGKTTLLHTLAGLRRPQHGEVRLDGQPLTATAHRERARTIGLLFQDSPTLFPATVLETVLTGRHPYLGRWQTEGPSDRAAAETALATVGLADFAQRSLTTLSGGERRRVELAALLAQDVPVCLLDEPVNHLDLHHQVSLLRQIAQRRERPGHLNLLVLHDVNLALRFCDHGLLLLPGGDHRAGPLDALLDRATLEAVFGCALREVRHDGERLFVPE
jgi:iron complex transport system ATP-binding protein